MTNEEKLQQIRDLVTEAYVEVQHGDNLRRIARELAVAKSAPPSIRKSRSISVQKDSFEVVYAPLGNLMADVKTKHVIWSDEIDLDDWRWFLEEEGLLEADEYEQYQRVSERNAMALDDERDNLNIEMNGTILAIGDLGLWQGRRIGYKEVDRTTVNGIFDVEASEYFCDAYNVRATYRHHDGTNEYVFRVVPFDIDPTPLLNALYYGTATLATIRRYTRSMRPYVSAVYGWGGRQLFVKKEEIA